MRIRHELELSDAQLIMQAASEHATKNNWCVSIAIVNFAGVVVLQQKLNGAPPISSEIAPQKAQTCVLVQKASAEFEKAIKDGRTAMLRMPLMPLEGGELIRFDDQIVGAVGVSGVASYQDAEVARAGIDHFLASLKS